jgi:2-polyprenyl-3-methyl-5-hydroxy-6-metoxy-1,4-benzoquinol methylase
MNVRLTIALAMVVFMAPIGNLYFPMAADPTVKIFGLLGYIALVAYLGATGFNLHKKWAPLIAKLKLPAIRTQKSPRAIMQRLNNIRDLVFPLIEGKRLLDIGCIGHDFQWRRRIGTFYYDEFRKVAKSIKGIDIISEDVERARKEGFDGVEVGDAETFLDPGNYDVIFAGELIEHLSNPGLFLKCAHKNLTDDGVLVLTTPNTFALAKMVRCFTRLTNEPPVNPEHTCYFTPATLNQLVTREGFAVKELYYSDYDYGTWPWPWWKATGLKMNSILSRAMGQFSQSFVVVLHKHS